MGKLTSRTIGTVLDDLDVLHIVDKSDTTDGPQGTSKQYAISVLRKVFGNLYEVELDLSSAQILTLGTPIQFGLTVPAGKAVQMVSGCRKLTYNSVAYTTNTLLKIRTVGATLDQFVTGTNALNSTVANTIMFNPAGTSTGATDTQLITGADLEIYSSGNPAAGNSPAKVYALIRLITL